MRNTYDEFDEFKRIKNIIIKSIVALMIFLILLAIPYTVKAGDRGVVLTWGKVNMDAKASGLHAKIPIAQTVVKIPVQTMKYDAESSSASKDLQIVHTTVAVNYHLQPEAVPTLYKDIGLAYESKIIQPAVQEVVKASTSQFTAEELITKRSEVKLMIDAMLHDRLLPRGIVLETTSITNFDFSEEFNKAIEQKVTAQQIALKSENDLHRIKIEKEQLITQSEAQAESIKLKADAEAYSLRVIREQLEKNNALIQYKTVEKWNGILPMYSMSSATPLIQIPMNMTG